MRSFLRRYRNWLIAVLLIVAGSFGFSFLLESRSLQGRYARIEEDMTEEEVVSVLKTEPSKRLLGRDPLDREEDLHWDDGWHHVHVRLREGRVYMKFFGESMYPNKIRRVEYFMGLRQPAPWRLK